jgi:hypothetical protein
MDKVIVYTESDGNVVVFYPSPKSQLTLEQMVERVVPKYIPYHIIDKKDVPIDRTFRASWKIKDGGIHVDMTKARKEWMERIRQERNLKLTELDTAYIRADETGHTGQKQKVAEKKQALRDLPVTFDLSKAATPAELKQLWPSDLLK